MSLLSYIEQFSERKISDIQENLKLKDKVVSGSIHNSLRYEIQNLDNMRFLIQFFGDEGLLYVSQGRRAGTFAPLDEIKEWMRLRGIPAHALYPIMLKIKEQGIPPSEIFEDVFAEDSFKEFAAQLSREAINELKKQLTLLFVENGITIRT